MISRLFGSAWDIFKNDMGSWVAFFLVFAVFASVAGTILPWVGGLFFLPMAIREATKSVENKRSPDVKALWDFDHLGNDLFTMFLYMVAQTIGLMMCFVGWPFAWIGFWYTAELAADDRVSAIDAMKLSWSFAGKHLGDTIALAVVSSILIALGGSLGLGIGILLAGPLVLLAWSIYWIQVRDEVYALAHEKGITVRPMNTHPLAIEHEQPIDIDLSHQGELANFQKKFDEDGSI